MARSLDFVTEDEVTWTPMGRDSFLIALKDGPLTGVVLGRVRPVMAYHPKSGLPLIEWSFETNDGGHGLTDERSTAVAALVSIASAERKASESQG